MIMGQVMFLVAAALGLCALGTYLGRDLSFGTARDSARSPASAC